MSDASDGLSGVIADRYRLDRQIGQGGMATVYLAHDQRHDSKVALKVVRPELASRLGGERFVREIRITAQLQHPNILPVFDSGEFEGNAYYVMPFVDGETLEQRLRSGPLPVDEAITIATEVADALAYAHERGFVHRDVKPSNIMLAHGHAMLADFGIARAIDVVGADQLTETGLAIGTAAYMSPEQALGQPIDGRTDIYSLGCVLYEMLAGTPPFTGSARAMIARHSADTVPSLRIVRDVVPEAVEQVIFKSMAKVPADRFANAGAFRDAIRVAGATGITATTVIPVRKRKWLTPAIAVAAVAVVALITQLAGPGGAAGDLDPDRIVVMPLRVSPNLTASVNGEDIATIVVNALNAAGDVRLASGDSAGLASAEQARQIARTDGAAWFITGSVTPQGDQASLELTLYDTGSGRRIRRAIPPQASAADMWRSAYRAANELQGDLIEGAPDIEPEWRDRQPRAIASFLRGEAAFRSTRLEEALDHYRAAVAEDSSFTLAVIRGAQSAAWAHRPGEAESMIETALRQPIPDRYVDFVRGYAAYLHGAGDSAVAALRRATAANPDLAAAWMQLGEVYWHLLPQGGRPDSLALIAYEEARRLDPSATNTLFHIIQTHLQRGRSELTLAEPLLEQFRASQPDEQLEAQLEIMAACVRDGPDDVDWNRLAAEQPLDLLRAMKVFAAAAAQPECALPGFRALLAIDTVASDGAADGRRYAALTGLQGLLVSQGRAGEADAVLDSAQARWDFGALLKLLDAIVDDAFVEPARKVADDFRTERGPYSEWLATSTTRLWAVGVFEATHGDVREADRIAIELAARAARDGDYLRGRMAESVRAHAALRKGNTDEAFRMFEALTSNQFRGDELSWFEAEPFGAERLAFARLLLQRREYHRALAVANMFDSPAPLIYTIYVRASLELRKEAATALLIPALETRFDERLAALH